jgi:rhodanese-related sulfurtransferase
MSGSENFSAISQVHPSEAVARLEDDAGVVLLDVRNPEETSLGHAPQAIFIPLGGLEDGMATLEKDVDYLVICRSGGRSQQAAEFLAANGFRAANVVGGMTAWAAEGYEVVNDEGGPGLIG